MDLRELENGVNPENHWYYQSKIQPLIAHVRKLLKTMPELTIIDVGSGSGFFAISIEKIFGNQIKKVCLVDINYTPLEIENTKGRKIEKMTHIPDRLENCLVVMMDVLEHIEDDLAMLQSIKKNSAGNNHYFITVPAFYSLWSNHDVALGHYRRYTIAMLNGVLSKANYNINRTYYLYGSLFPMIWTFRKLDNLKKNKDTTKSNMQSFNPLVNRILYGISSLDMKVASMNKLFGVTCLSEGVI